MTARVTLMVALALGATRGTAAPVPGVAFEQRIGATLPLETIFRDTEGQVQPLGSWLQDQPVVLWFGYARCPQLCSVVADGMVASLRELKPSVGRDFEVIMISIDPTEPADLAKTSRDGSVRRYGRPLGPLGWHYLRGNADAIRSVTAAAGFHYTYDPRSQQYAHPSGFLVLTRQGRISAYFLGVDFAPKDVAAAIARAGRDDLGSRVANLLLVCFHGGGISGRYGLLIWHILGGAVALTVLALAGGIARMLLQERRRLAAAREEGR